MINGLSLLLKRKTRSFLIRSALQRGNTFNDDQQDSDNSLRSSSLTQVPGSPHHSSHLAEPGDRPSLHGKTPWARGWPSPFRESFFLEAGGLGAIIALLLKHLAKERLLFHSYVDKHHNDKDAEHSQLQGHWKPFWVLTPNTPVY